MAIRLANKWATVLRIQPLGDKLSENFFAKDEDGDYRSYTNYTITAVMYDSFNNLVATPTVAVADGIPPNETATVTDGKVTITVNPSDMPTKEGNYVVWATITNDGDANDIETFVEIDLSLITKKFRR